MIQKKLLFLFLVILLVSGLFLTIYSLGKQKINTNNKASGSAPPVGILVSVSNSHIKGWAKDADIQGPITVHIYVDGVIVQDKLANQEVQVGPYGFDWNYAALGHGNHRVEVYAIGVNAAGAPDGANVLLTGAPQYINTGCAGLTGSSLGWCQGVPSYWDVRQHDTKLLWNNYIKIGMNNSLGGTITQLYSSDQSQNMITEHAGAAVQLSTYGSDAAGSGAAWFRTDMNQCDPTPYQTEAACLNGGHHTCRFWGDPNGAQVTNCTTVRYCVGMGAAAPWNPIQAQAPNCGGWQEHADEVDYSAMTSTGGWTIRKDNPNDFGKSVNFPDFSYYQTVELGDVYAKVNYEIKYHGNRTTHNAPQELPAFFTATGINSHFYYYAGSNPYSNPNSTVTTISIPANTQEYTKFLAFPSYTGYRDPTTVQDHPSEKWWGVCNENETQCVTLAAFDDIVDMAAINKVGTDGSGYISPLGYFHYEPGMDKQFTIYVFPYKYNTVVNGKSIRQRIFELHSPSGSPTPTVIPTATPRPTATPTPRPLITASPTPIRTPTATPRPSATPTPRLITATPTPRPLITASPTPVRAPTTTPRPTATPTPRMVTAAPTPLPTMQQGCPLRIQGDSDCNGQINNTDYYYYVKRVNGGILPANVNVDFNGDGEVGTIDRAIIIEHLR